MGAKPAVASCVSRAHAYATVYEQTRSQTHRRLRSGRSCVIKHLRAPVEEVPPICTFVFETGPFRIRAYGAPTKRKLALSHR